MAENNFRADRLEQTIHTYGIPFDENVKWDNEKMIKLLGDYFIDLEPEKYSWGARYVQSLNTVMLCKHMKDDLEKFKVSPLESEDYVAETKLNGMRCVYPDGELICSDGQKRKIKEIVDNKLQVSVLSFNEKTQKAEYKPVIGWYNNGEKRISEWNRAPIKYQSQLELTKDHKVYTFNRGYVEAQKISKEDTLCRVRRSLNKTQEQIVFGSYLGDSYIQIEKFYRRFIGNYRLVLISCAKQLDYLKLKIKSLEKFKGDTTRYTSEHGTICYRNRLKHIEGLSYSARNLCERVIGKKKSVIRRRRVTKELLNSLNWLGIAIWYMDDGYLKPGNSYDEATDNLYGAGIIVDKFENGELILIQKFLRDKGFECTLNKSGIGTLTLDIDLLKSQEFFENIAPYVPKCMEYKLPKEFRDKNEIEWWEDDKEEYAATTLKNIEFKESKDRCSNNRWYQAAYDVEVADNHNFFVDGILVHNCIATYSPDTGFEFFSRKESSSNFLNGNFTNKFLFIEKGIISEPKDYIGKFNYRFVLDGELLIDGVENEIRSSQVSIEDYIQSVFSSSVERARNFQKDGHRLKLVVFDTLYFEKSPKIPADWEPKYSYGEREVNPEMIDWVEKHYSKYLESAGFTSAGKAKKLCQYLYSLKFSNPNDVRRYPFIKRRELRKALVKMLNKYSLPFYEVEGEDVNKIEFTENILSSGGEGIILKSKHAPYISSLRSTRSHRAAMKVKQSVSTMLLSDSSLMEDFDVFITGANPPKSDRIKDMIGSLSCSIYIKKEDGTIKEHEIANVTGISHEWKKRLAAVDENTGKIILNPEYEGKVIAIDGLALTASKLKFQHATLKNNGKLEFKAKNPTECVWDEGTLKEMTLTRGK